MQNNIREKTLNHRIEGNVKRDFSIEIEFEMEFDANKFKLLNIKDFVANSGSPLAYSHNNFKMKF